MAEVPVELYLSALKTLVDIEKDWVPHKKGNTIYVRPFVFATEASIQLKISKSYKFCIILSVVGLIYSNGLAPMNIFVEDYYVRAV